MNVSRVDVVELRIYVPPELQVGGDARNLHPADAAASAQPVARPPVWRAAARIRLPAVAATVEDQRMRVDAPAGSIPEKNRRRPLGVRTPELSERFAETREVCRAHAEVEVVVSTRLPAEQRVDAPAPLDPEVDPGGTQAFDDVDDVAGRQ